eukprot:5850450-Prymnesium_polylepis.2
MRYQTSSAAPNANSDAPGPSRGYMPSDSTNDEPQKTSSKRSTHSEPHAARASNLAHGRRWGLCGERAGWSPGVAHEGEKGRLAGSGEVVTERQEDAPRLIQLGEQA